MSNKPVDYLQTFVATFTWLYTEIIIAWMALDLGSLVMVLSKVGTITNPELRFAVVSLVVSELSPVPAEL